MQNYILFKSTNGKSPEVDFRQALLKGQAPDKGLYIPTSYPYFSKEQLDGFRTLKYPDIATTILAPFTHNLLQKGELESICQDAYNFEVPLESVNGLEQAHILRLDRGPTASFKDFAARMMARLMGKFTRQEGKELLILVATSGDTGSAVASAFYKVPGIKVLVLFPELEVSLRQRKQMTTLGGNIQAIALNGKFDDCQALVKRAFADPDLQKSLNLSSANSINIGRLLPQSIYYFYSASRLTHPGKPLVYSVPSGNFGDMMAGILARQMGLPIQAMFAPVNSNDSFPTYLNTGCYTKIVPSRNAISNAMNVGHPSNLARLIAIYGGHMDEQGNILTAPDLNKMRMEVKSVSISDDKTRQTIKEAWDNHQLLLEPHGAVAWAGYRQLSEDNGMKDANAIVFETANPAKFPREIKNILGFEPEVPASLANLENLPENYETHQFDFNQFKKYLLAKYISK